MAIVTIDDKYLSQIGDAIRILTQSGNSYRPKDMVVELNALAAASVATNTLSEGLNVDDPQSDQ